MRTAIISLAVSLFAPCSFPFGASDAGAPADAGTASTADATASGSVQGAGCGTDPVTGVTLCTAVSLCPAVAVDHDLYPDCGFRIRGSALDLECECDGQLCPIGVPATCADAQGLLDGQSEAVVCARVNEGVCIPLPGGGPTSTCDQTCASQCAGAPGCIQLCGC